MTARRPGRDWSYSSDTDGESVETMTLRTGITLVLSRIAGGDACHFHHVEPEDVFGIGFHLKGGSRFDMESHRFETFPLDVWAGAAPRSSASSFTLAARGFVTVSVRFTPEAASDLLHRHLHHRQGQAAGPIADMIALADRRVATARLSPLDPAAARTVEAMFSTPYTGSARTLFLESCALGLLAAQIDAAARVDAGPATMSSLVHGGKLMAAREWLDAHLSDPPTIAMLSRIVGTNEFTLKRAFKETFGVTIFGYVRQRRMERAAAKLHAGQSVSETAGDVGYECPRCFADAFRRHFGVLPSEITRGALAAIPAHHG